MRFLRFIPLAALVFVGACDQEGAITNAKHPPLAFIRYVHAVPDIGALDFQFVDQIDYSPQYSATTFRTVGVYQGAEAGSRRIKVFRNSSNIDTTKLTLVDTTLTLAANTYYTILHMGYYNVGSGTPAQRFRVITDTRVDQNTGLHVGAINAVIGAGTANQDVFVGTPAGTPMFSNLAPGVRSTPLYAARATGTFTINTTATGLLVSLASATPIAGVVADTILPGLSDPVGGFSIAGTQFTAFLFPRSTAGSLAPQTAAFTVPAVVMITDRQPPRTVPN